MMFKERELQLHRGRRANRISSEAPWTELLSRETHNITLYPCYVIIQRTFRDSADGCIPELDVQNACVYGLVIDTGSFMDVTVLLFKLLNSKPAAGFRRSRPDT
jgi:hypothetical protein